MGASLPPGCPLDGLFGGILVPEQHACPASSPAAATATHDPLAARTQRRSDNGKKVVATAGELSPDRFSRSHRVILKVTAVCRYRRAGLRSLRRPDRRSITIEKPARLPRTAVSHYSRWQKKQFRHIVGMIVRRYGSAAAKRFPSPTRKNAGRCRPNRNDTTALA